MILTIIRVFSGVSHLIYGLLALFMPFYINEFERYGFSELRILIALAQVFGGIGLLLRPISPKIALLSSCLLTLMMCGALITRISIQDSLEKSLPALIYLLINSFIFIKSINKLK